MSMMRLERALIRATAMVLGENHRVWAESAIAELDVIPSRRARLGFALSSSRGLATIAAASIVYRWHTSATTLTVSVAPGIAIAALDLTSETRWPLRLTIILTAAGIGFAVPRVARIGGFLLGLGLPMLTTLSGYRGPYAMDRGDVWLPLLPATIIASVCSALRGRERR